MVEKVYYSALVKAMPKSVDDTSETDQKLDQVIILYSEISAHVYMHIQDSSCYSTLIWRIIFLISATL